MTIDEEKINKFMVTLRRALLTQVREIEKGELVKLPGGVGKAFDAQRRSNLQIVSLIENDFEIGGKKKKKKDRH